MTERNAPFLTAEERSHLNGDRVESRGYVRDADAIDRAADFVREALRAARRGGAA
jgi:predicted transcriptional regulator